jgi:hypothetical protein
VHAVDQLQAGKHPYRFVMYSLLDGLIWLFQAPPLVARTESQSNR